MGAESERCRKYVAWVRHGSGAFVRDSERGEWARAGESALHRVMVNKNAPEPIQATGLTRDWLRILPPMWLFRLLTRFGVTPPPIKALMDASAFMVPQWMYAVTKMRVPEMLANGQQTTDALALELAINPDRLGRLLYALEQRGYFRRVRVDAENPLNGPWINTVLSATLLENHPNTVRPLLLHWVEDCYGPNSRLLEALREDGCAFSIEQGESNPGFFSDFLPTHPDKAQLFSEAMTASSAFTDAAVLRDFNWGRFSTLVDAGGSNGSFLDMALQRHASMSGVLFDLPNVIEQAQGRWAQRTDAVSGRIRFHAGDFFEPESIPSIGPEDAVVLRNILHDWPDDACVRILNNIRRAMQPSSRLTLVELGLATQGSKHMLEQARSGIDMLMMTMFEGKERTRPELIGLLREAGFELVKVAETRSIAQVVEARPAV